jgi:hypothetical protein
MRLIPPVREMTMNPTEIKIIKILRWEELNDFGGK